MPDHLRGRGRRACATVLFALAAVVLPACATTGPRIPSSEIEGFEKVLRARSARYLIDESLRLEAVGIRLLRALPDADPRHGVPYLGLIVDDATESLADALGVTKRDGVLVLGVVRRGAAERGGIEPGDYLEKIGPLTITASGDLDGLDELDLRGPISVVIRRGELLVEALLEPEYLPLSVAFKIVQEDAVNAYSSPGAITVTTGMLRFVRSDEELAVVVSHELSHITRGHAIQKVGLAVPTMVIGVAAAILVPGSQRLVSTVAEKVIANVLRSALTKVDWDMEREADVFGLLYLHAAGYDPGVATTLWERFAVELPTARPFVFVSDHPPSSERLLRIARLADALRGGVSPNAILAGAHDSVPPP